MAVSCPQPKNSRLVQIAQASQNHPEAVASVIASIANRDRLSDQQVVLLANELGKRLTDSQQEQHE